MGYTDTPVIDTSFNPAGTYRSVSSAVRGGNTGITYNQNYSILDGTYSWATADSGWLDIQTDTDTNTTIPQFVVGVITQGRREHNYYTEEYTLQYDDGTGTLLDISNGHVFPGNTVGLSNDTVTNYFDRVYATKIRFNVNLPGQTFGMRAALILRTLIDYTVTVNDPPTAFILSGVSKRAMTFISEQKYKFDQSDSSNTGEQIVFGYGVDDKINFFTSANGVTVVGTPGQPGAYTLFEVPSNLTGTVYYYSANTSNLSVIQYVITVDSNSKTIGDTVTFTLLNKTDTAESYLITGVTSDDLNGADISGTVSANTEIDLSYTIQVLTASMVLTFGDVSETVTISTTVNVFYSFAVQTNATGDPVYALYNTNNGVYENQPSISFSARKLYEFDLSSSITDGNYILTFGPVIDNSGTEASDYIYRVSDKVYLDLRNYTGDTLQYFDRNISGMGRSTFGVITNPGGNAVEIQGVRTDLIAGTDFTIEFFVNFSSIDTTQDTVLLSNNASNFSADLVFLLYKSGNFYTRYYWNSGKGALMNHTGPIFQNTNQWYHVALVRYNNRAYTYVDGTKLTHNKENTDSTRHNMQSSGSNDVLNDTLYLFKFWGNISGITGSMASVRVSTKAVYTGNFTAPTPELSTEQSTSTNIQSLVSSDVILLVKADPLGNNNIINESEYSVTITKDAGITTEMQETIN
jgi:hypothetical protein